jgi:hypothetical protein
VVLTAFAAEVTAGAGEREAFLAGVEMIEGFLLDGVDGECTGMAIGLGIEGAFAVYATAAASTAVGFDEALVGAEFATDDMVLQFLII